MGFDLKSIASSKKERPFRIVFLGKAKAGKSTIASQAEQVIFLPIRGEEGIDALDVPAFPVIQTYQDLMQALITLFNEDHGYKHVVIDSVSTLEPILWAECCRINKGVDSIEKVGGGFSKGYTEVLKQWRSVLEALDALRSHKNMGSILIGHVQVEKHADPMCEPYTRYSFDIHKKAAEVVTRWADGVGFIQHKVIVRKHDEGFNKTHNQAVDMGNGAPFLYTQERPSHPGGGRGPWGKLPYELPLSWAALQQALKAANMPAPQQTA